MRKRVRATPAKQRPHANPFGAADAQTLNQRRQEANRFIVRMLSKLVEDLPSMRFNQVLSSLGYQMPPEQYYEEPWETATKVATAAGELLNPRPRGVN